MSELNGRITHIYKEGNQGADYHVVKDLNLKVSAFWNDFYNDRVLREFNNSDSLPFFGGGGI